MDSSATIIIQTDACETGFGAIVFQIRNGQKRIIENYSKLFSKPQLAYATVEKEAIAVVHTLKKFRYLLMGRNFIVQTDHKPLLNYFNNTKNANSRKLRMIFELQEYDYILQHIPGKENQDADLLSRINNINNINFGIEYQEIILALTFIIFPESNFTFHTKKCTLSTNNPRTQMLARRKYKTNKSSAQSE